MARLFGIVRGFPPGSVGSKRSAIATVYFEMKYSFRWVVLFLIVFVGGLGYFVVAHFAGRQAVPGTGAGIPVRVVQARPISLPRELKSSGELLPVKHAQVVSRLAGEVTEVRFKPGDFVRAGTVVATIRAGDLEQRFGRIESGIDTARANLQSRQDELAAMEKRLANDRELFLRDLIPRRDVEQSEAAVQTAGAEKDLARAQLAQREAMLAQLRALKNLTRLTAPISGEVDAVLAAPGGTVVVGGPVISLIDLKSLKLVATVNGAMPGVRPGAKAQISHPSLSGKFLEGTIVRVAARKSSDTETLNEIEIHVNNEARSLRPRIAVDVSIALDTVEVAYLVPQSAVMSQGASSYLFKYSEGRALRQQIVQREAPRGEIAIVQGLEEGDWVLEDYPSTLAPGARVKPLLIGTSVDAGKMKN